MNDETATRRSAGASVVRIGDLAGTFLFALEGALAAVRSGLDPVGVLTIAFVSAVGGGILRDVFIGLRPAAIADWRYAALVLIAAAASWLVHPLPGALPPLTLTTLDAAGLSLFAVVGTQKALNNGIHPLPAIFLGALGGTGGGAIRDILLNDVPRLLYADIYASAALLAGCIVALERLMKADARAMAILAGLACFALRMASVIFGWQLPHVV